MKNWTLIILILYSYACISEDAMLQTEVESEKFDVEDFQIVKELKGEVIPFKSSQNPRSFKLLRDSIMLVQLMKNSPNNWIELYSFPDMKFIKAAIDKGRGPGEFLSCKLLYNDNSDEFTIYDVVQSKMAIYNIDSLLNNKADYSPDQIKIHRDISDFARLNDSTYVGYNAYFIQNEKISNNTEELILFQEDGTLLNDFDSQKLKYFVANVTGGHIITSPSDEIIFVAEKRVDRLKIYNNNLQEVKILVGPDNIIPEYVVNEDGNVSMKDNKFYKAYDNSYYLGDYLYLLYSGLDGIVIYDEENGIQTEKIYQTPTKVFKMNWNGDLIGYYQLDRYIFELSITSDEDFLYGTHVKNFGEDYPQLVRYRLK